MEKMVSLEVSLESSDSERGKMKRLHQITSSSRAKEFVLGVGARYSAYLAKKSAKSEKTVQKTVPIHSSCKKLVKSRYIIMFFLLIGSLYFNLNAAKLL
jgi:hypothetical protein